MKNIVDIILAGACKLLALLPFRLLYILSDLVVYPLIYHVIKYRKKVVLENLRNSFPEKSDQEIKQIAKNFYHHFADLTFETVKLLHISPEELNKRMKYKNPNIFTDEIVNKKHALCVMGHYNNWEWGVALSMQSSYHFVSIYKPLTHKYFNELMIKVRSRFGGEVVPMAKTARLLMKYINEGKLTQMNFIADQSPYHSDVKYWTTFLNQDTPVFLGIEKLAQKTRQPVYFANIIKVKRGYYEADLQKLCDDCNTLKPYELTEMHVKALEKAICEAPEYWLWTHRRWKVKKHQQ